VESHDAHAVAIQGRSHGTGVTLAGVSGGRLQREAHGPGTVWYGPLTNAALSLTLAASGAKSRQPAPIGAVASKVNSATFADFASDAWATAV
jgi:hypothetical protein